VGYERLLTVVGCFNRPKNNVSKRGKGEESLLFPKGTELVSETSLSKTYHTPNGDLYRVEYHHNGEIDRVANVTKGTSWKWSET